MEEFKAEMQQTTEKTTTGTSGKPLPKSKNSPVDHPKHYNAYPVEVIEMAEKIFGPEAVYHFCLINAFKYRMRAGVKNPETLEEDLEKEKWYLDKMSELKAKF